MKLFYLTFHFLYISSLFTNSQTTSPSTDLQSKNIEILHPGQILILDGRRITVTELDITRVVENTFSKRGTYEGIDNSKLKLLRTQEGLDKVISGVKDEFDQQVYILDWAQRRLPKFGAPTSKAKAPLDILKAADEGNTFYCSHYNCIFVGAATSIGWIARSLALHVGNNPHGNGFMEHSVAEIWSNQYRKWILFDPLYGLYFEKDNMPLNAWEVRQEWFYGDPGKLNFVFGANRRIYKKSDLPISFAVHPGFGTLFLNERSFDLLSMIGYLPGNNVMDGGVNYQEMFISTDTLADRVKWHTRDNPKDPAIDSYFPINQADLRFTSTKKGLAVNILTFTPNFAHYLYRINDGEWIEGEPDIWTLKKGINSLEVKSVNTFGIEGEPSRVVLDVTFQR
jgi:hypothetical protein